jgi:hypothetical protein
MNAAAWVSLGQASHNALSAAPASASSTVSPWVFAAGLVILLGALVVVIMQLVRMRKVPPGPPEHEAPPSDQTPDGPISPDEPR